MTAKHVSNSPNEKSGKIFSCLLFTRLTSGGLAGQHLDKVLNGVEEEEDFKYSDDKYYGIDKMNSACIFCEAHHFILEGATTSAVTKVKISICCIHG